MAAETGYAATLYRHTVWRGSVPLAVSLSEDGHEAKPRERLVDCYYASGWPLQRPGSLTSPLPPQIQAPRISYLPLLLPDIQKHLLELSLDENALATVRDQDLWFELNGEPLKWHWPIGLLYDYHTSNSDLFASSHTLAPLRITLHTQRPPLDKILVGPSIDACRTAFMNMVKEADFIRWGSTRRVTALRKADQDALWDGVVQLDYDRFWSVASKLVPAPATSVGSPPGSAAMSREASSQSAPSTITDARLPEPNAMRSVPLRIYLPSTLPVLQDVLPPLQPNGSPTTLYDALSTQLPFFFPPQPVNMTNSFVSSKPLAQAIVQGVEVPLDAEIGFLAATLTSPCGFIEVAAYAPWPLAAHVSADPNDQVERQTAGDVDTSGPTLLPNSVALLVSQLSVLSRVSVSTSAFFLESMLDAARFSSSASLSLTRHALLAAITTSANQMAKTSSDDASLAILQRYSQLGCHFVHSSFSLVELFALSSINLAQSVLKTASSAATESVRLFDQIFGSTEASRALASIIQLVRRELAQDPRFKNTSTLVSLTKTLTAFVLVQTATRHRIAKTQKMTVLLDHVVFRDPEDASRGTSSPPNEEHPREEEPKTLTDLLDPGGGHERTTSPAAIAPELEAVATGICQVKNDMPDDMRIDRRSILRGSSIVEIETITTKHTKTTIRVVNEMSGKDWHERRHSHVQESSTEEWSAEALDEEWINLAQATVEESRVAERAGPAHMKKRGLKRFHAFQSFSKRLTKKRHILYEETKTCLGQAPTISDVEEVDAPLPGLVSDLPNDTRTTSVAAIHSAFSENQIHLTSFMEQAPWSDAFPQRSLVDNLYRYVKFASAAYGQTFLRLLNIGHYAYDTDGNAHAFCHHTGISRQRLKLTSFMEPVIDNSKTEQLVHYLAVDEEAKAIVLACRGSLGLSDILTDLTADFKHVHLPYAPADGDYFAHQGMLRAAQRLLSKHSAVHEAIKHALDEHPTYGLALVGHSLGAGVCSLLAALLARPSDSGPYVTSAESGLPEGRPIHCFAFGSPCVASPDLARYCYPLTTSVVHANDFVCTLSLGVLRDLKDLALAMQDEPSLMSEVVHRVTGLYRPHPSSSSSDVPVGASHQEDLLATADGASMVTHANSTPNNPSKSPTGDEADTETADWLWSLRQTMKAVSVNDKLLPPGRVLQLETEPIFVAADSSSSAHQKEADRVILRSVDDVASRFSEPTFTKHMLLDHSPANYEQAVTILHSACSRPSSL